MRRDVLRARSRAPTTIRDRVTARVPAGNPTILEATLDPPNPTVGETTTVILTLENQSSSNENYESVWIFATSPQFDVPVIHFCVGMGPGETREFGTGPIGYFVPPIASYDAMEGSFNMLPEEVEVNIRVGGLPDGQHCRTVPTTPTDQLTIRAQPTLRDIPDTINVVSCSVDRAGEEVVEGADLRVEAEIENSGEFDAEVELEWQFSPQGASVDRRTTVPAGETVTVSRTPNLTSFIISNVPGSPPTTFPVQAEIASVDFA